MQALKTKESTGEGCLDCEQIEAQDGTSLEEEIAARAADHLIHEIEELLQPAATPEAPAKPSIDEARAAYTELMRYQNFGNRAELWAQWLEDFGQWYGAYCSDTVYELKG